MRGVETPLGIVTYFEVFALIKAAPSPDMALITAAPGALSRYGPHSARGRGRGLEDQI